MRKFEARLRRLETDLGVVSEKYYYVLINGFRTFEDCVKLGRPFFRCPDGGCHSVMAVYEYHDEKLIDALDMSKEKTMTILNKLGYEEIKSKDEMKSKYESMSVSELTDHLLGREKII